MRNKQNAFTIVEAVISLVIVSVMLGAALSTVSSSRLSQKNSMQTKQGQYLAQSLLTEITQQLYQDPEGGTTLGLDSGESAGPRSQFDDVDDYHNWSASPPVDVNGLALTGMSLWQRDVEVVYVNPAEPSQQTSTDGGAKRVTVTASYNGFPVSRCYALCVDIDAKDSL